MIKLAIHSDLDVTLWNVEARNRSIIQATSREHGSSLADMDDAEFKALWQDMWAHYTGKTEAAIHGILAGQGHVIDMSAVEFERLCRGQWSARRDEAVLDLGMLRFLVEKHGEGHGLSVVTSSRGQDIEDYLALAGQHVDNIDSLFHTRVSSDDVPVDFRKPHPQPFLMSAEQLGVNPLRGNVFLEDSPSGQQSGSAAFPANGLNFGIIKNPVRFTNNPGCLFIPDSSQIDFAFNDAVLSIHDTLRYPVPGAHVFAG